MEHVFFSFVALEGASPDEHREYNRWHQLDHRPENLALPGVAWGDRWARSPEYKNGSGTAESAHSNTDYVAMYWFREPVEDALEAWDKLGESSFQWGRGPLIPGVERTLLAFFRPVKGYVSPSALVSPGVLPFRPNTGLHVTLTRFSEAHSEETHSHHRWEDRELIPALLDVDGVAGAWTFSFANHQIHGTLPMGSTAHDAPGSLRIRLLYLEDDPAEVTRRIEQAANELGAGGFENPAPEAGEVLLSSPVRTIIPWQDW